MSLLTSASIWNNTSNTNNKRISTLRKTIKNKSDSVVPSSNGDFSVTTIEDMQNYNDNRDSKVSELLNKITSIDENNNSLGDFKPIDPPSINIKKDIDDTRKESDYIPPKFDYTEASNAFKDNNVMYNSNDTPKINISNYATSYEHPKNSNQPYYSKMSINNDSLMDKINYMIHMMEEQQHEKTSNITEEFILYSFLGVFIIFVVDSFNRTAKYTR
jgi:hypothetical protein|tara:strand:- start:87 stop:734 length:648 start_codon:yes stop_codon:yes gene_type:complete